MCHIFSWKKKDAQFKGHGFFLCASVQHCCRHLFGRAQQQGGDCDRSLYEGVEMKTWLYFESTRCWDTQALRHLPSIAAWREWKPPKRKCVKSSEGKSHRSPKCLTQLQGLVFAQQGSGLPWCNLTALKRKYVFCTFVCCVDVIYFFILQDITVKRLPSVWEETLYILTLLGLYRTWRSCG